MTDSSIDRIRQLPQALVAHFIQTYLTDASAFALIATEKETFHRYCHWYLMKSECTWLCLHHRSGSEREWIFIHLREPRVDAQLLADSVKAATQGENDERMELVDESESIPFTQPSHQSSARFSHPLAIGIMNPSRIKLCEDSLETRVDVTNLQLPRHLKCFPSPLPNTVKHLFITPSFDFRDGHYGHSRWSEFVYPSRLEVVEYARARPSYFTRNMDWPLTLHTIVIGSCSEDFILPTHPMYLPANLTDLTISFDMGRFSRYKRDYLQYVQLPTDLKRLEYRSANSSPMMWNLPASLLELVLGNHFNEPITDWILPPNLTRLKFGDQFNQSLVGIKWPSSLTEITLTESYQCNLIDVQFPSIESIVKRGRPFGYHPSNCMCVGSGDCKSLVLDLICHGPESATDDGCTIATVSSQLPHFTFTQIQTAVQELAYEGHIWSTIDEEHFKSFWVWV